MVRKHPDLFEDRGILRDHRAAVAETAEVLGREEAEHGGGAVIANALPLVPRALRLRAVLDHDQLVLPGNLQDRVEVGRLAVQMHRDDGLRARRHLLRDFRRIEIEEALLEIAENYLRAGQADGFRRGNGRVDRRDDLIARADAETLQGGKQTACGAGHAADLRHALPRRHLLLERLDVFAADVVAAVDDPAGGLVQRCLDGLMLSAQIEKRYFHANLSSESCCGQGQRNVPSIRPRKNRVNLSCSQVKFNDIFRLSGYSRTAATAHGKPG